MQQSVLLHENHTVFVGMTLSARDQTARGSETAGDLPETLTRDIIVLFRTGEHRRIFHTRIQEDEINPVTKKKRRMYLRH